MPMYIHACIFENVCVGRELQVAVANHDLTFVGIKEISFLDPMTSCLHSSNRKEF